MEMLTLAQLRDRKDWKKAVVVFTESSFSEPYTKEQRSYQFSCDNKYFMDGMIGNSIFGSCLDGKDDGVRLDYYIHDGKWIVDHCYISEQA